MVQRWVLLIRPEDFVQAAREVAEVAPEVRHFLTLPILALPADSPDLARAAAIDGVLGVDQVDESADGLLQGLDQVGLLLLGLHQDWRIGGVARGQDHPAVDDGPNGTTAPTAVCAALNLSLRPPDDDLAPLRANDSINHCTRHLAQFCVPVVAAGNSHRQGAEYETVSPWAEPDWVLAVGATEDAAGTREWSGSARGVRGGDTGPDVLTWGASALGHPKLATSWAAPRASFMVVLARGWLLQVRAHLDRAAGRDFGVPLVGVAVLDRDFTEWRPYGPPADWAALPVLPMQVDPRSLDGLEDIVSAPSSARRLVEAVARETSVAVDASAPSLTQEALVERLDVMTPSELRWVLTGQDPPPTPGQEKPIFPADTCDRLRVLVSASMPVWEWDIDRRASRMRHDPRSFR